MAADERYFEYEGVTGGYGEQTAVLATFTHMLAAVTADGGRKRAMGNKTPWWCDPAHEPAIFSHLSKWKHGERKDGDSGAHPLVHLAWRALAIAYQETHGLVDPQTHRSGCSQAYHAEDAE